MGSANSAGSAAKTNTERQPQRGTAKAATCAASK
jgi:hypothetical protein